MTFLSIGQQWKNNNSGIIGTVSDYDFLTVTLNVVFSDDRRATLVVDKPISANWTVVEKPELAIEVGDKFKGAGVNGSVVEIIWAKEDGTKFLVRSDNSEWLLDRETIEKYWTKIIPEVLPEGVTRVNLKSDPNTASTEDTVALSDVEHNIFPNTRMRAITNFNKGVLLVGDNVKNNYFGITVSLDQLKFLVAEREKYEAEKNS